MVSQTEQNVQNETLKKRQQTQRQGIEAKQERKGRKKKKDFFKFSAISKAAKGCILLYVL